MSHRDQSVWKRFMKNLHEKSSTPLLPLSVAALLNEQTVLQWKIFSYSPWWADRLVMIHLLHLSFVQGSDPLTQTARGKLQTRRAKLNDQINKELRMRSGAENLYRWGVVGAAWLALPCLALRAAWECLHACLACWLREAACLWSWLEWLLHATGRHDWQKSSVSMWKCLWFARAWSEVAWLGCLGTVNAQKQQSQIMRY